MDKEEKLLFEFEPMLEKDHESLLSELREKARYVEINKRKEFENHLLRFAQEMTDDRKRNAVYEVLVSLHSLWNQYQPGKGLQEKFRAAFAAGNYKEAEEIYKKLARQGLDYPGTFQLGEGRMMPLSTEDSDMILHYNKKELNVYSLRFELLEKISILDSWEILDIVLVPFECRSHGNPGTDKIDDSSRKIWILFENKEGRKGVGSIDSENIKSKAKVHQCLEQPLLYLDETLDNVYRLSCFQNRPLLVSRESICYYSKNGKWEEWYSVKKTGNEITAFDRTWEGFWVGHANGDVFILKNLERVGVRTGFKGFLEPIKQIRITGRHVLISSKNCLRISDSAGNPVSEPLNLPCEIIQAAILNDEFLLLLLANGMIMARELMYGNVSWQINLGNSQEMLFTFRQYIMCGKRDGEMMLFEIPPFHTMEKELESKNIYVEKQSFDMDPNAPVRYIPDFIGRREILNEIKENYTSHFLLYGEPRVGKTSLLYVLRDVLSERARSCIIDMAELLKNAFSFESFEQEFMEKCLAQYFMKLSDLPGKDGYWYQALRAIINKIRGTRSFCVIGIDNFRIPTTFDKKNSEAFKSFFRSMALHEEVRLIFTCRPGEKADIERYFDSLDISGERNLFSREIPLFTETEAKNALRKKISVQQQVVNDIYKYTGRFPHLIHLYDRWKPGHLSIEEQSDLNAKTFSEKIFDYFRELSLDARLLMATCLYENLVSERVTYTKFYERFPFFKNSLSKDQLDRAIKEMSGYGSGLSAQEDGEAFQISLSDNARLFREAARHIPWIKDFKTLYEFTSVPDQERADKVARMFTRITQSAMDSHRPPEQQTEKHKDKFYVNRLTDQGLQALKMPLTTFLVFSLIPWQKELHLEALLDLNSEFQELCRKAGEPKIFYILLFDLHGIPMEKVKKDLEGLDRISVIDAPMMKHVILAESPKEKASDYIFNQLSIKERSPYTTAGAVPDNLFFGRQMELALIRGLPENIGIFGIRTIGKTSLLRRLRKAFQSQRQWKVYDMDCARIESEELLLKNLAEKMEVPYESISDMEKFRKYITKEAETGGHRYLFLLDEVDRLVQYDIGHDEKIFNIFNRLCNETMKNNETAARFILFGFQQMFEQMKDPLSRLYNFMVFLPLQTLDMEGAMNLVTRPIENIRVRWNSKEDAGYLVDSCSRHPRLLQAACHALLTNLDTKGDKRDIIERTDVEKALTSPEFLEICMRLYYEKGSDKNNGKKKEESKKKNVFFPRRRSKDMAVIEKEPPESNKEKEFLNDLHRITILAAIRLLLVDRKEIFTILELQKELKSYGIEVSPNIMRNILDRLCLSGNFRLRDESTIIAKQGIKGLEQSERIKIDHFDVKIDHPDIYVSKEATIPLFTYEFGVKIFPKLLAAHFGGAKQCEEERRKLIEKGDWREWLRRY